MRITETMQQFLVSKNADFEPFARKLRERWLSSPPGSLSSVFALLWGAMPVEMADSPEVAVSLLVGSGKFDDCYLEAVDFTRFGAAGHGLARSFVGASLIECSFAGIDLSGTTFEASWLESVSFQGARLTKAKFTNASLLDVDMTDSTLDQADLLAIDSGLSIRIGDTALAGARALGALAVLGATVPDVDAIYRAMAHPLFPVAHKIARKILEPGASQVLGLTKRGSAAKAQADARRFVELLEAVGFVRSDKAGSEPVVEATAEGRRALKPLVEGTGLPIELATFFGVGTPRK